MSLQSKIRLFDVVTKQKKLNYLLIKSLIQFNGSAHESKMSLPMTQFSGYHASYEYCKIND